MTNKTIDYGMSKTLKHVDTTLPHAKPKTLDHVKENLAHLNKIRSNAKKQIEHHAWEHKSAVRYRDVIQPKWEAMGYTANKEQYRAEHNSEVKFHKAKLDHYTKLHGDTVKRITTHKATIDKASKPVKTVRRLATKIPANHLEMHASMDLVKDHNYFARKAKLLQLRIDHDVNKSLASEVLCRTSADFDHEYHKRSLKHPYYEKMSKLFQKTYHERKRLGIPMYASESMPYRNLMLSIYDDCAKHLKDTGEDQNSSDYSQKLEDAMKNHPEIRKLDFLKGK